MPEEIRRALGSRYNLWERLIRFIERNYRADGRFSRWGPQKSGWNLRFRSRGKALVALYPQDERIMVQVVLGKPAAARALELQLGDKVRQQLREAPQLHDGRWLFIAVREERDAEDVEQLLLVKVPPMGTRE
jgi:hypothetical protein